MMSMGEYLVVYRTLMHRMLRYASVATMPTREAKDNHLLRNDKCLWGRDHCPTLSQNYRSRRMVKYPEQSDSLRKWHGLKRPWRKL